MLICTKGVFLSRERFGNYIEVTRVARHEKPPALAAAVSRPGRLRWADGTDLHCSLGHAHDVVFREAARQLGIKVIGCLGYGDGCRGGKESATPSLNQHRAVLGSGCGTVR